MAEVTNVNAECVNGEQEYYLELGGQIMSQEFIQELRARKPKKPARKVAYCQTRKQGFSLLK